MPKRGKNEGTVRKRADGRWEARVDLGYRNGKRVRKSFYGSTRSEVARLMNATIKDFSEGSAVPIGRLTLADHVANWISTQVEPRLRPKTVCSYKQYVRLHILPELGRIQLSELRPQHIDAFLTGKLSAGLSPRTVAYMREIIRNALNCAVNWELISRNPVLRTKPVKQTRHLGRVLTSHEVQRLFSAIENHPMRALFIVTLSCGLRMGEVLGLTWTNVDLDRRMITISKQLQRMGKSVTLVGPKSDHGRRKVPLSELAIDALRRKRGEGESEGQFDGAKLGELSDLVFKSRCNTPLDDSKVRKEFKNILAAAGIAPMRFHDLRHSCASLLLSQGASPRLVMEVLGHGDIRLTMNTYAHIMNEHHDEAARLMDLALENGRKDGAEF